MGITRKQFLAAGASAASAPLAPTKAVGQAKGGSRLKNVLFLITDQHKPDCLGVEGDGVARTPNIDAFAKTAVRFSNAYCADPVCTPSRASILTGLHSHNHRALYRTGSPFYSDIERLAIFSVYSAYFSPILLAASKEFRGKSAQGLYGDGVEEIDWSVGQIIQALEQFGVERETVVFFPAKTDPGTRAVRGTCEAGRIPPTRAAFASLSLQNGQDTFPKAACPTLCVP